MRRLLLQQPQPNKDGGSETTGALVTDFVLRKGDRLILHDAPFRFISFNVPNLHVVEDEGWHRASLWEQEDALQTIARMGGQVVRTYPLSIVGGLNNGTYTHVLGKEVYNEALLCDLDQLLVVAGQLNVRLIVPFIDHWEWWGGIPQFTKLYNASFGDFYRSSEVKEGFKDLVKQVVMRRNTLTGRLYRDDPAILAWESGNELDYVDMEADTLSLPLPSRREMDEWMSELAAYIKGLDPNHLVIDGRLLNNREVSAVQLEDPHIDLISDHFYPNAANNTFEERLAHMVSLTKGHKPFLVGEFGLIAPDMVDDLAKRVIAEPAVAGALLWSLRSHNVNGGFYWHHEYDNYWAYHYPGKRYEETPLLIQSTYFDNMLVVEEGISNCSLIGSLSPFLPSHLYTLLYNTQASTPTRLTAKRISWSSWRSMPMASKACLSQPPPCRAAPR